MVGFAASVVASGAGGTIFSSIAAAGAGVASQPAQPVVTGAASQAEQPVLTVEQPVLQAGSHPQLFLANKRAKSFGLLQGSQVEASQPQVGAGAHPPHEATGVEQPPQSLTTGAGVEQPLQAVETGIGVEHPLQPVVTGIGVEQPPHEGAGVEHEGAGVEHEGAGAHDCLADILQRRRRNN